MNFNQFNCRNCQHDWISISEEDFGPEFCSKCGHLNVPEESSDPGEEPINELNVFFNH